MHCMGKDAGTAPTSLDVDDDYWNFLQSVTLENNPLPEDEEEDDPEYLDDLSNKIKKIVNKGLLPSFSDGHPLMDSGFFTEDVSPQQEWPVNLAGAKNYQAPPSLPQQDHSRRPPFEEEGTLQPPVCSRTRARFPMTDVDIDELVQQLCSEKESLIVPEENIEDNALWDLLSSPPPFNFDDIDLDNLDFSNPQALEDLREAVDQSPESPSLHKDNQHLSRKRPRSTPDPPLESASEDIFSLLNDENEPESSSSVPTVLVDTPFAAIPMKTDAWSIDMIKQLHKILNAHGQMLLQAYGLSVGHAHLTEEACEVQKMLSSITLTRKFGAQMAPYPRLIWRALERKQQSPNSSQQYWDADIQAVAEPVNGSCATPDGVKSADKGDPRTSDQHVKQSVSIPWTVMDIPYADLLPHLWYAIKQLSSDPVTGNTAQSHGAQGRNFRTKGFSLLEFPSFIQKAFEPLQVFLPNILSVDVHPRGPFWCKAEDLLLHWGLTIHQGNWEVIQQTYLPGKKAKEIEHREGSTEKRRRIKVMKGVSLDDLVPQICTRSPSPREIQGCLEELSRLAMTPYTGASEVDNPSLFAPPSRSTLQSLSGTVHQSAAAPCNSNNTSSTAPVSTVGLQQPCVSHPEAMKKCTSSSSQEPLSTCPSVQYAINRPEHTDAICVRTTAVLQNNQAIPSSIPNGSSDPCNERQQQVLQECERLSSYRGQLLAMLGRQSSQIGAIIGQLDDYGVSLLLQSMNPANHSPAWLQAAGNPTYSRMFSAPKESGRIAPDSTGRIVAAVANLIDAVAEAGAPAQSSNGQSEVIAPKQHLSSTSGPLHLLSAGLSSADDWRSVSQSNRLSHLCSLSIPTADSGVQPCSNTMHELQTPTERKINISQDLVSGWEQGEGFPRMSCGFSPTTCPPVSGSNTPCTSCLPDAGDQSCGGDNGANRKTSSSTPCSSDKSTPLVPISIDNISSSVVLKISQQKGSSWSPELNSLLGPCCRSSGGSR